MACTRGIWKTQKKRIGHTKYTHSCGAPRLEALPGLAGSILVEALSGKPATRPSGAVSCCFPEPDLGGRTGDFSELRPTQVDCFRVRRHPPAIGGKGQRSFHLRTTRLLARFGQGHFYRMVVFPFFVKRARNSQLHGRSQPWSATSIRKPSFKVRALNKTCFHALKGKPQTELDLSGSAKGVDACAHSHTVYIVPGRSGSVDLSRCARQQPIQRGSR